MGESIASGSTPPDCNDNPVKECLYNNTMSQAVLYNVEHNMHIPLASTDRHVCINRVTGCFSLP